MGSVTEGRGRGDGPEISIITIFFNEERYLAEAVASVAAQRGCDWELLLVDDGSTDASPAIARRLAAADPDHIRYLTHPDGGNRGMSASRNVGIAEARGRWLTFLDADDVWCPGKLEAQLDALTRHPGVDVLVSPATWWYETLDAGSGRANWTQPLGPPTPVDVVVEPPTLLVDFLEDEWRSICDLVIHRDAVAAVGGYEPLFRGMYEDQAFHAKVLSRLPAIVTADSWYRYRQHDKACTATSHRAGGHLAARRRYLRWLASHLADGDPLDDPDRSSELAAVVRRQRRLVRHPRLTRVLTGIRTRVRPATGSP